MEEEMESDPEMDEGMGASEEESMMEEGEMDEEMMASASFRVRIENLSPVYEFTASGLFNTPAGAGAPGPLAPGEAYVFEFEAPQGAKLSFATMFVQSNDLFYAPDESGIPLFEEGTPISGDVTDQVFLWDAGTEVNQEPGVGEDQAPRQAGPDTGPEESRPVGPVEGMYTYPAVDEHIQVTVESTSDTAFMVRIENVAAEGSQLIAPGVWVVHTGDAPLFSPDEVDRGEGLEALAEDGDPSALAEALSARTGLTVPLAPGVWAVYTESNPIFEQGEADPDRGLEALAEDGDPSQLNASLEGYMGVQSHGVFNTPVDAESPGPLGPGGVYEFTFSAEEGQRLSFATMFVQSNDLFYAPEGGIELFSESGEPISGDISGQIELWDAGTEVNQVPGIGPDQAPRQAGADTGAEEEGVVGPVHDMYTYPEGVLRVTITPDS
jgi:hypothetical protein